MTGPDAMSADAPQVVEQQGVSVAFSVVPADGSARANARLETGDQVSVRFTLSDAATRQPLTGAFPAGWMSRRADGDAPSGAGDACRRKAKAYLSSDLLARPEVDLNTYHVLTMNDDATISVVDPFFSFGGSKLLSMVFLDSPGADWDLSPDGEILLASQPQAGRVALADTATWRLIENLDVGPSPSRVVVQPDGKYAWVAHGDPRQPGVAVIDLGSRSVVTRLPTGAGPHDIVVDEDSRFVFVANRAAGTVTVIDVAGLAVAATIETGPAPVSMDYSARAQAVLVAHRDDGSIVVLDRRSLNVLARLRDQPGLSTVRVAPDGRLAFTTNPRTGTLGIIDLAANRFIKSGVVPGRPEEVAFTDYTAYVRTSESEIIWMVPLADAAEPRTPLTVVDLPAGNRSYGPLASLGASMVQASGEIAMLLANPNDQTIYYYKEGMAAPMGKFQTYSREPRAVMVVDRSLQQTATGVYATDVTLRAPGGYDVVFVLDVPRVVHCFELTVHPAPESAPVGPRVVVKPESETEGARTGQTVELRFRLYDQETGAPTIGIEDFEVQALLVPGLWQKRLLLSETEPGLYSAGFSPPRPGTYSVNVQSRALGLQLGDRGSFDFAVAGAE